MGTFVTLAEVLEARGSPLEEDEVWCLLLGTAEALTDISHKGPGNMCSVLSPGSMLLSARGNLAFKSCARSGDLGSFTAPEVQEGHVASNRTASEKMVVYSLGMTLYWSVDYQLPQNQPIQLSDKLNNLLLSMCEDMAQRRADLVTVLETCDQHIKTAQLPPPEKLIKQLVEDVFRDSVDHVSMAENGPQLTDRSQMVRERLHSLSGSASHHNSTWALRNRSASTFQAKLSRGIAQGLRHRESYCSYQSRNPCSPYLDGFRRGSIRPIPYVYLNESTVSLNEKKAKDMGPEFIRMLDEPLVVLELPGSIVSKKGKSPSTMRELSVVMPNGQSILVKCDVKSGGGDVFNMIVAHSNLVEHFYFGLAYIDDNEFFFLDNDTKISKVAPDSWKKVPTSTFVLFFRVKFFVHDISLLLHKLTRHQYYLQLRKDILEDRLACHEETGLYLGALALQAEYGDCMPEVYGRNYYRPDQYVAKSIMEKRALPYLKEELLQLHANNSTMSTDESELEFLKATQQLPEYGVLFYRVGHEKKPVIGELILGVCAKGVIVYEVKDGSRSTSQTFHWRETNSISSSYRKFVIESRGSKKKHTFVTERSKTATYLCNLCSAQHKFHNEMNSRQLGHSLASEDNIVQYAAVCRAQNNQMNSRMNRYSETVLTDSGLTTPQDGSMNKLCDDIAAKIEARIKQQRVLHEQGRRPLPGNLSPALSRGSGKCGSEANPMSSAERDTQTKSVITEREVICVSLKKDPKLGVGVVIVGEDTVGKYDLGIFIASIVPGGPADKDGRIRPGGRLISLNHTSLEGVPFSEAAEVMQNSPQEVTLIVAQPKVSSTPNNMRSPLLKNYESQTNLMTDVRSGEDDLDEIVSVMLTPKTGSRLQLPDVRILNAQDACSRSPCTNCFRGDEISVELKKKAGGGLGISIAGGVNTGLRHGGVYIQSLVCGGAAEQDGRIQSGDRLLKVDGISFQGFTYQQAVECLARTGKVVTLVLERENMNTLPRVSLSPDTGCSLMGGSLSPQSSHLDITQMRNNSCPTIITPFLVRHKDYSFVSDGNTLEVTLKKRLNGLGFSFLVPELNSSKGDSGSSLVRIKKLFPGQPAEESGRIQEGDVILAVNGEPLKGLSYQRVVTLLRGSPSEVRLSLCRPAPGILPPIETLLGT
ncbi:tyrosine-protein phosphatase non-receptor type 13-like isoform X2 [Coregonus clupeaformis]|uniref:tyrosine-protein phosphatase non-receptor type 13-like isoform X2 n=1 Tax=Coregonus clupeaformis TaxID=59861 RepID=UPI001E1C5124|nr:tyrosine-protein phosphatase non-receptor type 13-like isoform X2 [Coregonus clupeaformis]